MSVENETTKRPGPDDDTLRRYADLVKINAMKTKYIDREQEIHLLEKGVTRFNLSLDDAERILRKVAEENRYVFETEERRRVEQIMGRHAGKSGLISREQFETTAQILRDFTEKSIGEQEARRQLKRLMLQNGWRPRRDGLRRSQKWFTQVEV